MSAINEYIIGIDPSSLAKSNIGMVCICSRTLEIIQTYEIEAIKFKRLKSVEERIQALGAVLKANLSDLANFNKITAVFEHTVMQGKGGESLNRAIGAIISHLPETVKIEHISNSKVKKIIGGRGDADKVAVAQGLRARYQGHDHVRVSTWLLQEKWDLIDACAIANAYIEEMKNNK